MKVELIAELATNFGGSVDMGKRFIRNFAKAGVDTIKIQVFHTVYLRPTDPQYHWFKACQLQRNDYVELRNACKDYGVKFLATGYNPADVKVIADLGCDRIKIGSGEAMEVPMAQAVFDEGLDPLVSLGLVGAPEYTPFFYDNGLQNSRAEFLGCITRYPAPSGIAYHYLVNWARSQEGCYTSSPLAPGIVGWSDHSIGLDECKGAILAGAKIVEFHVQLDGQARDPRPFEKTYHQVLELRAFADENPAQKYLGRWQHA